MIGGKNILQAESEGFVTVEQFAGMFAESHAEILAAKIRVPSHCHAAHSLGAIPRFVLKNMFV